MHCPLPASKDEKKMKRENEYAACCCPAFPNPYPRIPNPQRTQISQKWFDHDHIAQKFHIHITAQIL